MHPIEHLRFLARSSGFDASALVQEAAYALSAMPDDLPMLVVVCRRLIERHPTCAQLWWLCAEVLTSEQPSLAAWEAHQRLDDDDTFERLADAVDANQTVAIAGWSRAAEVLAAARSDIELTLDPGAANIGGAADVVVVEAVAASSDAVLLNIEDAQLVQMLADATTNLAGDTSADQDDGPTPAVMLLCPLGTRLAAPIVAEIERRCDGAVDVDNGVDTRGRGGGGSTPDVVRFDPDTFDRVVHSGGVETSRPGSRSRSALGPDGTFAPELLVDTLGT